MMNHKSSTRGKPLIAPNEVGDSKKIRRVSKKDLEGYKIVFFVFLYDA